MNTNRVPVTVEFFYTRMDADDNAWLFNEEDESLGMDPWKRVEVTAATDGQEYFLCYGGDYDYREKKVGPEFKVWVQKKDLPAPTDHEAIELLRHALVAVTSDLTYQIDAKHGPKVAYNYPSIAESREVLERLSKRV